MKKYIIIIWSVICFGGGWFIHINTSKPQVITKLEVKEVEKPIYRTIKELKYEDNTGLWSAYNSPIIITHAETGDTMTVKASDGYKSTEQKLQIGQSTNWKMYACVSGLAFVGGACLMLKALR